ncbi:MAG: hypothetical protein FWD05_04470 [Oscillospiraceae bacterium]|nr:hypothetical protein [Oscillospiraceae bacterium]
MKKRWIPVILLSLVVAILIGLRFGTDMEQQRFLEAADIESIAPEAIAVVNSDTGAAMDGVILNYSAAIIDTLGDGFILVSPAMAQTGLEQGVYSAILTFPSHVSERIVAFNTETPERVQLEFRVNPNLAESNYIMTHLELLNLQLAINTTVANTYVTSLFSQFHTAQDEMGAVFRNNITSREAIDVVYLRDFTPDLDLDFLPEVPFEPNEADTSEHLQSVAGFAEEVRRIYRSNFELAATIYSGMRDTFDPLVDGFDDERAAWIREASAWIADWVQFSGEVDDFFALVIGHQGDLVEWRANEAMDWHGELEDWHDGVEDWYDALVLWYGAPGVPNTAREWFGRAESQVAAVNWEINEMSSRWNDFFAPPLWTNVRAQAELLPTMESVNPDCTCICPCEPIPTCTCDTCGLSCNCSDVGTGSCGASCACPSDNCCMGVCLPGDCPLTTNPDHIHTAACLQNKADELSDYILNNWAPGFISAFNSVLIPTNAEFIADWIVDTDGITFSLSEVDEDMPPPPTLDGDVEQANRREVPPEWNDEDEDYEPPTRPEEEDELPPDPHEILAGIHEINYLLQRFNVGDFMPDELSEEVGVMLAAYSSYLDFIRADLSFQFMENIFMLFDVRSEYIEYLNYLRTSALESEYDVRTDLQATIYEFYNVAHGSGQDTYERLSSFTGMLPESRTAAGINQELVNFTIAPFEFMTPVVRAEIRTDIVTTSNLLDFLLLLALIILAILVILAVTLTVIEYVKKMKAESKL